MDRKQKIISIFDKIDNKELVFPLIDHAVFLEGELERLKGLPFIVAHPERPDLQKRTPAARQYKEDMQSYVSVIRTLQSFLKNSDIDADSELLAKLKEFE